MAGINESLRHDLAKPEFSEGYAESFHDVFVATQLKVLREQNGWTQADLAERLGTTQTAISRIENVNYSAWNLSTLKKLARAFRLRLKVSFETYGSLIHDVENFSRVNLQRLPREADPELRPSTPQEQGRYGITVCEPLQFANYPATNGKPIGNSSYINIPISTSYRPEQAITISPPVLRRRPKRHGRVVREKVS